MPLGLQKYNIKRIFNRLNPNEEPDNLDWDVLDSECCFSENRDNMKRGNPQYKWDPLEHIIRKAEAQEKAYNERLRMDAGLDPEYSEENSEESFSKKNPDTNWQVEQTDLGETHSTIVEIKPHTAGKGKKYHYGRIQLIVDPSWVGFKAKITVSTES